MELHVTINIAYTHLSSKLVYFCKIPGNNEMHIFRPRSQASSKEQFTSRRDTYAHSTPSQPYTRLLYLQEMLHERVYHEHVSVVIIRELVSVRTKGPNMDRMSILLIVPSLCARRRAVPMRYSFYRPTQMMQLSP